MEEARDLLREVKRRRQIFPQKGVLKKTGLEKNAKSLKRLRFAEECNEIYEIPLLDSSPSHTIMAMPGGELLSRGLTTDQPGSSVDWIKEATRAAAERTEPMIVTNGLSEDVLGVGDSFGDDPGGTSAASPAYSSSPPRTERDPSPSTTLLTASSLDNLRAMAAALPTAAVARSPVKSAATLSDVALESLLWED